MHATGGTIGGGGGAYYPSPVYNGRRHGLRLRRERATRVAGRCGHPAGAERRRRGHHAGPEPARRCDRADGLPDLAGPRPSRWFRDPRDHLPIPCVAKQYADTTGCTRRPATTSGATSTPWSARSSTSRSSTAPTPHYRTPGYPPSPADDCTTGNGNNAYYHRVGYAAFYLSGYSVNVTSGLPQQAQEPASATSSPATAATAASRGGSSPGSSKPRTSRVPAVGSGYFGTYTIVPAG